MRQHHQPLGKGLTSASLERDQDDVKWKRKVCHIQTRWWNKKNKFCLVFTLLHTIAAYNKISYPVLALQLQSVWILDAQTNNIQNSSVVEY